MFVLSFIIKHLEMIAINLICTYLMLKKYDRIGHHFGGWA